MTKTYKIEVDCANCAEKMQEAARKTEGVSEATVSFMTQKMKVEFEEDGLVETYKLVTTMRGNSPEGLVSVESPIGKALLGHKAGDRVYVEVNASYGYYLIIKEIEKNADEEDEKLRSF